MTERSWNSYVNADGLRQTYGRGEAELGRGGTYNLGGPHRVTEVVIVGADLRAYDDSTDATTVVDWNVRIPPGAFLEKAEFEVQVAFESSGSTATLSMGLADASDMEYALTHTGTLAADGIDQTIAETAIDAVGDTITCDGAQIGTKLPTVSDSSDHKGGFLVTAEAGTNDFTAGEGILRIYWRTDYNSTSP